VDVAFSSRVSVSVDCGLHTLEPPIVASIMSEVITHVFFMQ